MTAETSSPQPRGGRPPRQWNAAEQAIIDCYFDGVISFSEAATRLRICRKTFRRHVGRAKPRHGKRAPVPQVAPGGFSVPAPDGWTLLATRTPTGWLMAADAPVLLEDARKLVELGRAVTTQRRVGDGFQLLFRWVQP